MLALNHHIRCERVLKASKRGYGSKTQDAPECLGSQRQIMPVSSIKTADLAMWVRFLFQVGRFCRDINECQRNPCDSNQHCINTRGSYMCRCRRGFQQVGNGRCMDTDECRQGVCRGNNAGSSIFHLRWIKTV